MVSFNSFWRCIPMGAFVFAVAMALSIPAQSANACGDFYKVKPGDTLARIAKKCGQTVPAILAKNDQIQDPSQLRVGWKISIPGGDTKARTEAAAEAPARITGISGTIVNSQRCAQLHTPDGEVYGLVSPKVLFRSGTFVEVSGAFARKTACNAERTIVVSELQRTR